MHVVHRSAGRVDVEVDVLALLLVLQVQHLHHHARRRRVVDLADEEDDAVLEQELVDGHLAGALVVDGRKDLVAPLGRQAGEDVRQVRVDGGGHALGLCQF